MRVGSFAVARPQYYDRNPIERTGVYSANAVAPHAATVRFTYTVAAGKKAYADAAFMTVLRDVVATTTGIAQFRIVYTPSGVAATNLVFAITDLLAVGTRSDQNLGGSVLALAGAVFDGTSSDTWPDGSNSYRGGIHAIEFDA